MHRLSIICLFALLQFRMLLAADGDVTGEEVPPCTPVCEGQECGDDSCGGVCGLCGPYDECLQGLCSFNGGCEPLDVPGCGGCTCESCTCQLDPYCCTSKWDPMCVSRCQSQCGGCGSLLVCGDGLCEGGEGCSSCPADCGSCSPTCGQVTGIGCCAGATYISCQSGELKLVNCIAAGFDSCGWLADEGSYGCGGSGLDPTLEFPMECPTVPVEDVSVDNGTLPDCGGLSFAGCCKAETLYWCDVGGIHALDCSLNPQPLDSCGWNGAQGYYDCGGVGTDPSGENTILCPDLETDTTGPEEIVVHKCSAGSLYATGCMDIPFEGCCGPGGALYFCEKGKSLCVLECSVLLPPSDSCGWYPGLSGYYDCGGTGADPDGIFPYACPPIFEIPDLAAEDKGQDEAVCKTIPATGCCEGTRLKWCEAGVSQEFDCAALAADPIFGAYVYCGTNDSTGEADCLKKPDPSPPLCLDMLPEPASEIVEQSEPPPPDLVPEIPLPVDLAWDGSEVGGADGGDGGDGMAFVIPTEAEPEPKKKKSGRCSFTATPTGPGGAMTLLLLTLVLMAVRRRATQG